MIRKQKMRDAAAETTHTAAERGTAAYEAAVAKIVPLVEQAGEKAGPLAHDAKQLSVDYAHKAKETLEPLIEEAMHRAQPHLDDAKHRVQPLLDDAAAKVQPYLDEAKHRVQPAFEDALHKVAPAYESAKDKVEHDLLPRLIDALEEAAESPTAKEAQRRGAATLAALKGDLVIAEPTPLVKRGGKGKGFAKLALVSAAVAGALLALRKYLAGKNDGWTAHQPSPAYTTPEPEEFAQSVMTDEGAPVETPVADEPVSETTAQDVVEDISPAEPPVEPAPADDAFVEDAGADEAAVSDIQPATIGAYGEGSYVGDEPPAEYTIKGNERSMKYHTADSGGYERTIADVWFISEEAAEAAGFTRAQR